MQNSRTATWRFVTPTLSPRTRPLTSIPPQNSFSNLPGALLAIFAPCRSSRPTQTGYTRSISSFRVHVQIGQVTCAALGRPRHWRPSWRPVWRGLRPREARSRRCRRRSRGRVVWGMLGKMWIGPRYVGMRALIFSATRLQVFVDADMSRIAA
jgi:hypothetical protein